MSIGAFVISPVLVAFVGLAAVVIGAVLAWMHVRHQYQPSLIGILIGAFCCFLLLEALPAIT